MGVGMAFPDHIIMRFGGRDISVSSHYVVGWAWHLISISLCSWVGVTSHQYLIIWLGEHGRGIS